MKIDLRNAWVQIHLWLGLSFGLVGVLIGLTGSVLVFDHEIDARLNPQRYALSGTTVALPYSAYLERAAQALEGRARPVNLRLPEEPGLPVTVIARARGEGGAVSRVYLDPQNGNVLEAGGNGGFVAWAHNFHESLTLRQYSGREIVGAVGVAMLISSLSGIYLWWPGRGRLKQSLGMRRGFAFSRNLHYLFGFYGSLMLAMLSFTGIYLAFPDAGRATTAVFGTLSPPARNVQAPEPPAKPAEPATEAKSTEAKTTADATASAKPAETAPPAGEAKAERKGRRDGRRGEGRMDREGGAGVKAVPVDDVVKAAQALYPAAQVASIGLPAGQRGVYRVGLNMPGTSLNPPGGSMVAFFDPANGNVLRRIDPPGSTAGDKYLAMMRPLHAAIGLNLPLQLLYFVAGLLPVILATTGTLMWLRKRRAGALADAATVAARA